MPPSTEPEKVRHDWIPRGGSLVPFETDSFARHHHFSIIFLGLRTAHLRFGDRWDWGGCQWGRPLPNLRRWGVRSPTRIMLCPDSPFTVLGPSKPELRPVRPPKRGFGSDLCKRIRGRTGSRLGANDPSGKARRISVLEGFSCGSKRA